MDAISMFWLSLLFHFAVLAPAAPAVIPLDAKELSDKVKTMMLQELHLHSSWTESKEMRKAITFQDKIGESILTSTPNGACLLMDSSEVSDCFTYFVDSRKPAITAKFTMSPKHMYWITATVPIAHMSSGVSASMPAELGLKRNMRPMNMTVTLYEINKWKNDLRGLGRATLDQREVGRIRNLRIEVIRNAKGWFNSNADVREPVEHRLKVDVLVNNHPVSYFNVFVGAPELDIDYYDRPSQIECDPRIECCLVPHYVNFTEIGWNKFIMYPVGFYANYCIGPKHVSCAHEDPEVESILSTARVQSNLPLTKYKCAPRTFAPLNILYSVGPNHSMKLRLDDVRALSCSCMN